MFTPSAFSATKMKHLADTNLAVLRNHVSNNIFPRAIVTWDQLTTGKMIVEYLWLESLWRGLSLLYTCNSSELFYLLGDKMNLFLF